MIEIAPRITVDKNIRFGKPVISGTRISVETILGKLAIGMTYDEIMQEYEISHEDILAVLHYASKVLSAEEIRIAG